MCSWVTGSDSSTLTCIKRVPEATPLGFAGKEGGGGSAVGDPGVGLRAEGPIREREPRKPFGGREGLGSSEEPAFSVVAQAQGHVSSRPGLGRSPCSLGFHEAQASGRMRGRPGAQGAAFLSSDREGKSDFQELSRIQKP